jgi:hypothetical protein
MSKCQLDRVSAFAPASTPIPCIFEADQDISNFAIAQACRIMENIN